MPDIGSLELITSGTLTAHKAEMMGLVKHQIRNQFRTNEVDIGEAEVCNIARMSIEIGAVDLSEVYSPHRVTSRASEFGFRPGFAVDLREEKPSGGPWDLSRPEDAKELKELQSLGSFHRFIETHGRNYSSKKEYKHRYGVFKQNMKKVQFLRESEQGTAEYGHTIFADFTEMEFKQYTGMAIWKGKRLSDDPEIHWPPAEIPNVDLPEDGFDWRQHGAVSEVKNQVILIHVSRMKM